MMGQHIPKRGDDVETWLKEERSKWDRNGDAWFAIDDLINSYRLHADTGMPIDQDVTDWPGVRV
jgi:hypothetical protein